LRKKKLSYHDENVDQADWEDMTGSTPLEVNKDVVHFTTKVSALFWILVIHDQQR